MGENHRILHILSEGRSDSDFRAGFRHCNRSSQIQKRRLHRSESVARETQRRVSLLEIRFYRALGNLRKRSVTRGDGEIEIDRKLFLGPFLPLLCLRPADPQMNNLMLDAAPFTGHLSFSLMTDSYVDG